MDFFVQLMGVLQKQPTLRQQFKIDQSVRSPWQVDKDRSRLVGLDFSSALSYPWASSKVKTCICKDCDDWFPFSFG